jgi:hypothetical protein
MQVKNIGKRRFVFEDFEIKGGELLEVEVDLQDEAKKLVEMYPRELQIVEVKKVAKTKKAKAEKVEDTKAE